MNDYPMTCCGFHATGGHSADRHGFDAASKVYQTDDVDAHLKAHGDPAVPNQNPRVAVAWYRVDPLVQKQIINDLRTIAMSYRNGHDTERALAFEAAAEVLLRHA